MVRDTKDACVDPTAVEHSWGERGFSCGRIRSRIDERGDLLAGHRGP